MYLIVGLGNPGKQYEKTRHNAGFLALDEFAKIWQCGPWRLDKKSNSLVTECLLSPIKVSLNREKVVLTKPQTLMNNSGKAVASLVRLSFRKLSLTKELAEKLIVVHDDIDIPLGKIKVSTSRGSAGHKGVESIIQSLGTKNFTRIRIGIQQKKGKPENVEDFVLQKFKKDELPLVQSAIGQATESLGSLLK